MLESNAYLSLIKNCEHLVTNHKHKSICLTFVRMKFVSGLWNNSGKWSANCKMHVVHIANNGRMHSCNSRNAGHIKTSCQINLKILKKFIIFYIKKVVLIVPELSSWKAILLLFIHFIVLYSSFSLNLNSLDYNLIRSWCKG